MEDSIYSLFGLMIVMPAAAKQLGLSALIGFVIGLERALRGKVASMRTFSTSCCGSCLFTILSISANGGGGHDVTRVAAQIVTGIGFLGGGVIFKTTDRIEGITTGALIWLTSALGMACGFNQIAIVFWSCLFGILVHITSSAIFWLLLSDVRPDDVHHEPKAEA